MKRVRFLAVIMVAALMMMGVGYAAWTDTLTLTTTVNTGNFDMQFMQGVENCYVDWSEEDTDIADNTDFTFDADSDKATITLKNLYPDAKGDIYLKVGNYGTVPAKLDGITVDVSSAGAVGDDFQDHFVLMGAYREAGSGEYTPAISSYVSLADFCDQMTTALENVELAQTDSDNPVDDGDLYLKIPFTLANEFGGKTIGADEYEKSSITITLDFNWKQFNM